MSQDTSNLKMAKDSSYLISTNDLSGTPNEKTPES